ncbi:MAG: hypothetical protein NUV63_04620 [Gallionella sp.]|nr:hypothetical protein [Gallionella sp.]
MKLSKSDFTLMHRSIVAICASVAISAAVLYSSGKYAEKTQKDLRNSQNMLGDARNRLAAAHEDQKNMSIYADEYGALIDRKIIGDDQRLDWMEGLEKLHRQNLVTDFRYSIAPQTNYAPQPPIDSGNFNIHYSGMKLQFDLLHEAQLVNFFDALHSQIKGHYQLENCAMQRIADVSSASAASTHLKAECNGGWITLKNRNVQP